MTMNPYSEAVQLEDRIHAASPAGLTLILMEQAVVSVRAVQASIRESDPRRRAREVTRLLEILTELSISLRPDVSGTMQKRRQVYASLQSMLIEAHGKVSVELFATVEKTLVILFDGWKDVCRLIEGAPLTPPTFDDGEDEPDQFPVNPYLEEPKGTASRAWKF